MLDVEVLGWCGYTWSAFVRPRREMNIQFTDKSSGGHSCSQYANITLCDKTAHFRVVFYCVQPKSHLCNNHAV